MSCPQVVSLISVATGSFPPLYMHAQQSFMDGEYVKSSGIVAYCAELCASVMLLCAMYREDVILLKYFTYVGMGMAACSLLVYAMVIGILDMLTTILIIVSLCYQVYLILLVRSVIVEIKEEAKMNRYRMNLRQSDIEAIYYIPERKYSALIEPDTPRIEPEDSPVLPKKEYVAEPGVSADNKSINENIEDVEVSIANKQETLSYPFKFVAIKIPKEGTSKEDDKNEGNLKKEKVQVSDKDVKSEIKEKTDEEVIREIIRPPKRSIFGRWKKEKVDKSITSETIVNETIKP
ncbi:hypothetical protein MSG28_004525 [Choristoneura fumiferana]|uniref:Uncharacterized protein n=1 Tax=Choristoneura fumiferana TaxID=7141 RepID=A0ACC0K674_CHOFU|nr:hypothetical protein MSG28_004525 [Choristoneura fumiferana]